MRARYAQGVTPSVAELEVQSFHIAVNDGARVPQSSDCRGRKRAARIGRTAKVADVEYISGHGSLTVYRNRTDDVDQTSVIGRSIRRDVDNVVPSSSVNLQHCVSAAIGL